jgi:hypothetical protein
MDANQALLVGNMYGLCAKEQSTNPEFGMLEMHMDENGDYESRFFISRPSGKYEISISKVPEKDIVI